MKSISSGRKSDEADLGGLDGVGLSFAAQSSYEHVCCIVRCRGLPFLLGIRVRLVVAECVAVLALIFSLRRGPKIAFEKYTGCLANLIAPCLP